VNTNRGRRRKTPGRSRRCRAAALPKPRATPSELKLLAIQVDGWLEVAATVRSLLPAAATAAAKGKLSLLRIAARFFRLPHIDSSKLPQPITEITHHVPRVRKEQRRTEDPATIIERIIGKQSPPPKRTPTSEEVVAKQRRGETL
jgi:hypothetical protein